MRVVGYLRVSTDRQAEEGSGLEVQQEAIEQWALSRGLDLVGFTTDEGISGSNGVETRLGLAEALEALREGRVQGLVVYRLDRLARDLVLQEQLLAEVWRMGCQVFSTSAAEDAYLADDPADPSRRLIRQVLGAVSEYERAIIALRLKAGRTRKAATGGYAGGRPPFGFKAVGKELVHDDDEQAVLQRVSELKELGMSLREIAAFLDREGYPCRTAARWHPSTIARLLQRETVTR